MQRLQNELNKISQKTFPKADQFEKGIAKATARVAELEDKLKSMGNTKTRTPEFEKLSQDLDNVLEKIDRMGREAGKQIAELKLPEDTDPTAVMSEEARKEFEAACKTADILQQKYDQMRASGEAWGPTKEYTQTSQELEQARADLSSQQAAYNAAKADFQQSQEQQFVETNSQLEEAKQKLGGMTDELRRVETSGQAFARMGQMAKSAMEIVRKAADKAKAGIKALAGHVASATRSLGNMAVSGVRGLTGIGKQSKSSANMVEQFGKRIWGLAKRVFIFSVITKAFRAVRAAFGEGIGYYLSWDNALNSQVQTLKNSVMELKANFGGAFAPLVQIVVPVLQTIIGWLNSATNAVGAFIAAMTGKSTYKSVVAGTAVAGAEAAKNIGDTTNEVKKLKKELADYDELKVISQDDGSSSGSGAGGSGGGSSGPGIQYQDVDIGSGISDFAKKLKEAWERADFTEIGGILGRKLKEGLDMIPWPEIQAAAAKIGKSLATLINGFVETEGLAESIGTTLGETINTGLTFALSFLDNLHFDSIGAFVADSINSMLDTIDWEKAYAAAQKWGTGVAQFLNEVGNPETLGKIGEAFGSFINTLVYQVQSFVHTFDWGAFGTSLATGVQSAISTVDWLGIADSFGTGAKGFLTSAQNFFQEVDWFDLGTKLKEAIASVDWTDLTDQLFTALGNALGGIAAFLAGLFGDAFQHIGDYFGNEIEDAGGNIVVGIFNGITKGLASIGTWIKEHILDPFIKGFKDVFGIHSPSKEMEPYGEYIVEGIINGIKSVPGKILEGIKWLWEKITGDWGETIKDLAINIMATGQDVLEAVGKAWDGLVEGTKELITEAKEKAGYLISTIKNAWEVGWNATKDLLTAAKEKAGCLISTIKNAWENGWTATKNLLTAAKEKSGALIATIKNAWENGWTTTKNLLTAAKEKAGHLISTIKDAWSKGWTATKELITKAKEKAGFLISTIKDAWSKGWTVTKNLWTKAKEKTDALISTIKNAWTKGWTETKELYTKAKEKAGHLISTLKDAWENGWTKTKDLVANVTATFFGWLKKIFPDGKETTAEQSFKVSAIIESAWTSLQGWFNNWFGGNTVKANVELEEYNENKGNWMDVDTDLDEYALGEAPDWAKPNSITVTAHAEWEDDTPQKLERALDEKGGVTAGITDIKDETRQENRVINNVRADVNDTDFRNTPAYKRIIDKARANVTEAHDATNGKAQINSGTMDVTIAKDKVAEGNKRSDGWTARFNKKEYTAGTSNVPGWLARFTQKDYSAGIAAVSGWLAKFTQKNYTAGTSTINGWMAKFNQKSYVAGASTISGWLANFSKRNYTAGAGTSSGWTAELNYYSDRIRGDKSISGFEAWIRYYADKIPWINKVLTGFQAWVSEVVQRRNEKGGVFAHGSWKDLPQYAGGGAPTHGTAFIAGEHGAEIVGTVGGRTEVLNRSQIAMAIYQAVKSALTGFGSGIVQQLAYDANILTSHMDMLPERMKSYIPDINQIKQANAAYAGSVNIDYDRLAAAMMTSNGGNGGTYVFTANLDGREIFRNTVQQNDLYKQQTGRSALA